jgi:hypothetical protein
MRSPICWSARRGQRAQPEPLPVPPSCSAQFSPVGAALSTCSRPSVSLCPLAAAAQTRSRFEQQQTPFFEFRSEASGEETIVESAAWCCEQPPVWLQRQCCPASADDVSRRLQQLQHCSTCTPDHQGVIMETLHPGGAAAAVSTAFRVFSSMLSVGPNKGLKISPTKAELELDTPHSKSRFFLIFLCCCVRMKQFCYRYIFRLKFSMCLPAV